MDHKREAQPERRRHRRYLCSHLVEVTSDGISQTALLEDIGPGGAGLALDALLKAGTVVEMCAGGFRVRAEVRYGLRRETDFRAGLEFTEGFEWSREVWTPEHLWRPD